MPLIEWQEGHPTYKKVSGGLLFQSHGPAVDNECLLTVTSCEGRTTRSLEVDD